jgi:small-conductance mechanosensitive channel
MTHAFSNRLVDLAGQASLWLTRNSLDILIALLLSALVVAALMGLRKMGVRLCRTPGSLSTVRAIFGRALRATRNWFIVTLAIALVAEVGNAPVAAQQATHFLLTITTAFQAAIWLREIIVGWISHRAEEREGGSSGLGSAIGIIQLLVSVTLFAVAGLFTLDNLGINVSTLIAGLGIGGIAIGLAAQGIFKDLFAALSILFDRPFRRGQRIEYGTIAGDIEAIGLKTTRLRSATGELVIVSNARLLDQDLRNISERTWQRAALTLHLIYRNDPAVLATLPQELQRIVEAQPRCRFIQGLITDLSENAIVFQLLFRVEGGDGAAMAGARHAIAMAVLERFAALGIAFLYPAPPPPEPEAA